VKEALLEKLQTQATASSEEESPLDVAAMRLVYLTQRVPGADARPPAVASSCRPLTDLLMDSKQLYRDYGVATHSWLLLKRKYVAPRQQSLDNNKEEEEEEELEEEWEGDDEAAAEEIHAADSNSHEQR